MENNVRALRSQLWFLICFMCKLPPQNTNDAREGKAKKIFSSSQFFTSSIFFKGLTLESVQIHQGWMNDLDVSKTCCIQCLVSCVCLFYLFFFDLAGVWIEVILDLSICSSCWRGHLFWRMLLVWWGDFFVFFFFGGRVCVRLVWFVHNTVMFLSGQQLCGPTSPFRGAHSTGKYFSGVAQDGERKEEVTRRGLRGCEKKINTYELL